jgi:hypothetical protein
MAVLLEWVGVALATNPSSRAVIGHALGLSQGSTVRSKAHRQEKGRADSFRPLLSAYSAFIGVVVLNENAEWSILHICLLST